MKIAAQVFGVGAMICLFLIYQQKSRKGILLSKLCTDVCWVLHYALLGAVAGLIPNAVGIFRELIFMRRKDKKWANLVLWPILFILINWGLGFSTFKSLYNILPIAGSTAVTIALWIDNPRLTKIVCIPTSLAFLIYDVFVGSYIGIVNETIGISSIVIWLIRAGKQTGKAEEDTARREG